MKEFLRSLAKYPIQLIIGISLYIYYADFLMQHAFMLNAQVPIPFVPKIPHSFHVVFGAVMLLILIAVVLISTLSAKLFYILGNWLERTWQRLSKGGLFRKLVGVLVLVVGIVSLLLLYFMIGGVLAVHVAEEWCRLYVLGVTSAGAIGLVIIGWQRTDSINTLKVLFALLVLGLAANDFPVEVARLVNKWDLQADIQKRAMVTTTMPINKSTSKFLDGFYETRLEWQGETEDGWGLVFTDASTHEIYVIPRERIVRIAGQKTGISSTVFDPRISRDFLE